MEKVREEVAEIGPTPPAKWRYCDGQQLGKLLYAGLLWLEKNQAEVNALNVFPVPDGDTGTNMWHTMRSAYDRIKDNEHESIGEVAGDLAHGALMGARGNSGVILSQIWRGLARGLKDKEKADVHDMALALELAAETAYKGVMRPVEGTILTVMREGSEEAADAAHKSSDLRFLLERVLERTQMSLARTPELLPVLKQAGVVDSGGQGLVFILEGMLQYVSDDLDVTGQRQAPATLPAQALAVPAGGFLENPYDVQFILMGKQLSVDGVRNTIDAMGDSTVVVGDEKIIKVHVHVKDPGQPLSYGISLGHLSDVVVENMQMQMEELVAPIENLIALAARTETETEIQPGQIAVVAVAAGVGLADVLRSLGVAGIVSGGQTSNPSTEELLEAIEALPTDAVVVLPNNKNIQLAAEAARDLSAKRVAIVPTTTMPQGASAMLSWRADGDFDRVVQEMQAATAEVSSGEITTATRSVSLNGVSVEIGEIIGLVDGSLCAAGDNLGAVVESTLATMNISDCEILSIYFGQDVIAEEAETVAEQIKARYPELEIELFSGGQPHYYYILGAE